MKTRHLTERQKLLLAAHQSLKHGVNLGVRKSMRKGYSDTPLFAPSNQTDLFNPQPDGTKK